MYVYVIMYAYVCVCIHMQASAPSTFYASFSQVVEDQSFSIVVGSTSDEFPEAVLYK